MAIALAAAPHTFGIAAAQGQGLLVTWLMILCHYSVSHFAPFIQTFTVKVYTLPVFLSSPPENMGQNSPGMVKDTGRMLSGAASPLKSAFRLKCGIISPHYHGAGKQLDGLFIPGRIGDLSINDCVLNILMTQPILDKPDVCPGIQ